MKQFKLLYRKILRYPISRRNCLRLIRKDFTIISSNCVGGVIYHDLNLQFQSPTINLWFLPEDYFKFVENLDKYFSMELTEKRQTEYDYPIGILGDLEVYFMHYKSFEDAKEKWERRIERINKSNIFIMMTESPNFPEAYYQRFEDLPYAHKVLFTANIHKDYPSTFCLSAANKLERGLTDILQFKSRFSGKRWLDEFDYVSFLNQQ